MSIICPTRTCRYCSRLRYCFLPEAKQQGKLISNFNMLSGLFETFRHVIIASLKWVFISLLNLFFALLFNQVVAKETELVLRDKVQIPCRGKRHKNGEPCIQKDILYRILCLAEEAGRKYRVHLKGEK